MNTLLSKTLVCFLMVLASCRIAPIYNAENIPISPRVSATGEEISEAIWSAGRREGWRIYKIQAGEMRGTKDIQVHLMTVKILYDRSSFSIYYVSSANLKEADGKIHVNYNFWIKRLQAKIQEEINYRLPSLELETKE